MKIENFWQTKVWKKDKIPEKELIDSLLKKTFDIVPSKQSLVPYKIVVLGPDSELKKEMQQLMMKYYQPAYELDSPYVLIFAERKIEKVSPSVQRKIWRKHPFRIGTIGECKKEKSIEVGMFATIFTELCLENELSIAYTLCFPDEINKHFKDEIMITDPLLILSVGYSNQKGSLREKEEYKPDLRDILQWI
tara:strand:+ start:425 stop:1000 length:576 start_codon:yes stop_codon:yes gene_type:complete